MNGLQNQPESIPRIMMIAGEASGDLHGAALYRALKQRMKSFECIAMGGVAMRDAGLQIVVDSTALGVIGIWDVLTHYIPIRVALQRVKKNLDSFSPDLLICIDYKEFNFRIAKYAKSRGIKVLFYVSPQVWAWRPGRVDKYGEVIDMMAVIFPFEVDLYKQHAIPVQYVGHPLLQVVKTDCSRQKAISDAGLNATFPIIGLLPGSRHNEIRRLFPVMLKAADLLRERYPQAQFVLPKASNIDEHVFDRYREDCCATIYQCKAGDYNLLQCCDIAISASGTATLELALLSIPMVIVYKVAPLTYWFAKRLVRIPFIGLPNILAGQSIVPELIQDQVNMRNLVDEVSNILDDKARVDQIKQQLSELRLSFGEQDGIESLAELAENVLRSK